LTLGVIGGGGGMKEGVTLQVALYYRDASSNMVIVGSTTVTNTIADFPTTTHFVDYTVHVPAVKAADASANQNIGVLIVSTTAPELQGGYWDIDNVRLIASPAGPALSFAKAGNTLHISWPSQTGLQYQLRSSQDLKTWSDYGTPIIGTGGESEEIIPTDATAHSFFSLTATPAP